MRKTIILTGSALLLMALLIASLPLALSTDTVRSRIAAHLSELTGKPVEFRGTPKISFQPFLGIEISNLVIPNTPASDDAKPLLSVERVTGKLEILPALLGNIEVSEYQLFQPAFHFNISEDGRANWHLDEGLLKDAYESTAASRESESAPKIRTAKLGGLTITDGSITYVDQSKDIREEASNINASLVWPETSANLSLSGTAIWRNENASIDLKIDQPMPLLAGGESEAEVSFGTQPLTFNFEGKANLLADLFVKGTIEARSPSLSRLSQFLKLELGETNLIGEWTASGKIDATATSTLLSDAEIGIDGNVSTGLVRIAETQRGKLKLDGTLAFGTLDVSSYFEGTKAEATEVINRERSANLDMDLRISAQSISAGKVTLEKVAAAIALNEGDWIFDIGDAEAFGGNITVRLESNRASQTNLFGLKVSTNQTNIGSIMELLGEQELSLEGTGNITADLRTLKPFSSLSELDVSGSLSVNAQSGALNGIDLPQILSAPVEQQQEAQEVSQSPGERTTFETLSLKFFLNNSNASISKANLITRTGSDILLLGDIDFRNGALALRAQEQTEAGPEPSRLIIGGTLATPLVSVTQAPAPVQSPEPESLEPEQDTKPDAGG